MKKWWLSKTIWLNVVTAAVVVLGLLVDSDLLREHPQLLAIVTGLLIPAANLLLRWITGEPITSLSPRLDGLRRGLVHLPGPDDPPNAAG